MNIIRSFFNLVFMAVFILGSASAKAESAVQVLGGDFQFKNKIEGMPWKLSDVKGLQIKTFVTSDKVKLSYWEAGSGEPLIFTPAWSANGAEYVNVISLLSQKYHVYVLDPRNQGLSDKTDRGMRITRFAMDLKEFTDHAKIKSAYFCGWSMGVSVLWSYIDLFGTQAIKKAVFVDEPVSIFARASWDEKKRLEKGSSVTNVDEAIEAFKTAKPPEKEGGTDLFSRFFAMDSKFYENSELFAQKVIKTEPQFVSLILFDHFHNDWTDVIANRIDIPTAIFTGDFSPNLKAQQWIHKSIKNSKLYVYKKSEQGDHFLMLKNPVKFSNDLTKFLSSK